MDGATVTRSDFHYVKEFSYSFIEISVKKKEILFVRCAFVYLNSAGECIINPLELTDTPACPSHMTDLGLC